MQTKIAIMSYNMEFFNTHNVEGRRILSFKGFVHASQVAGTNFLVDFVASFSDIFGGNSGVYRETMNELYKNVFLQLEEMALAKGANAVIGVHLDFDNISGKGMSMFMVSAQGTAVTIEKPTIATKNRMSTIIDGRTLEKMLFSQCVLESLKQERDKIQESVWTNIFKYNDVSIANALHDVYLSIEDKYYSQDFVNNYLKYFSTLPHEKQTELAYLSTTELALITKYHLFDARRILLWAQKGSIDFAIECLKANKPSYNEQDVLAMDELYNFFVNLPDIGKFEEIQGGILSHGGIKYVCICGKKNEEAKEFCSSCGKNIKGLTKYQVELIEGLRRKISILKELLKEN